jgi:DNA-binding NtrC family response regulator
MKNWISWKGNVREIENFAQRMFVLLEDHTYIDINDIENIINHNLARSLGKKYSGDSKNNLIQIEIGDIKDMENKIILEAAKRYKGDKTMLADKLGISRTTLWKKLKEMGELV